MDKDTIIKQFNSILSKEYQSIWLIKVEDLSIEIYSNNVSKAAPNSVDTAKILKSYETARIWYIENYVIEHSQKRLLEQTAIDYIISEVAKGDTFRIEYVRVINGISNFNQLCYDIIVNDTGDVEYIVMGFRDIDITKKAEIDDLTGLLTRYVFFNKAEEMMHDNPDAQFDVVMSDIVDFKKINETYGVSVADAILKWNGEYVQSNKKPHTLLGRYGSDQLVIFGTHESVSRITSRKALNRFYKAEKENGLPSATWKFGAYENIDRNSSIVASCDKAHAALNVIKHHYIKDIYFYDTEIDNLLEKQHRIEKSMYRSLENEDFKVYYQPKHDASTGKLVGAEALIRWIHPEYGFMSPADFIPLFEQNGFIVESDRYVWRRTCSNLRGWIDRGIPTVPISVNASKLTIENNTIAENMKNSIEEYNISSDQLHIEITETLMTDNTDNLIETLNDIRDAGFKIELDDFGSGYSSINILSILPIDILKLDMTFMHQFGDKKRSLVLESCIDLAKKLGFKTVSEGVEKKEQSEALVKLGVDMIQGYYYSKPLPEEEFEKYLIEHL